MKIQLSRAALAKIWLLAVVVIALFSAVWVAAQTSQPLTESTKDKSQILPPSFSSEHPAEPGVLPPDDNPPISESAASGQQFSYFTVSGPELQPRSTANDQVYASTGCSYMSSGASTGLLTGAGMHIPDGSVIKYIRLYYNDMNASAGVDAFLTRYAPGTATADLVSTGSTNAFSGGFGFVVSSEITETVNTTTYSYLLYGWPDSAVSSLQVCGIRVAYYAPPIFGAALPVVIRK